MAVRKFSSDFSFFTLSILCVKDSKDSLPASDAFQNHYTEEKRTEGSKHTGALQQFLYGNPNYSAGMLPQFISMFNFQF